VGVNAVTPGGVATRGVGAIVTGAGAVVTGAGTSVTGAVTSVTGAVVAVDGGGSKTDAVALGVDGTVLARGRAEGSSPQILGTERALAVIDGLVLRVLAEAGVDAPAHVHAYLSGLDLPDETAAFRAALEPLSWVPRDPEAFVVDNDMFALLRAGTDEPDAVAVVCGTGINAVGVRRDGCVVRYPALGMITGDWGGGWHLGEQALWHAVRAGDGRGPATLLAELAPGVFGLDRVDELVLALHRRRIDSNALRRLCPTVFEAAARGDEVAGVLVDRQAEEIVTMAATTLRRLELLDADVPVVLGGGVIASGDARLMAGISDGMSHRAPRARLETVAARPVVGAALLAMDAAGAAASTLSRVRAEVAAPTLG